MMLGPVEIVDEVDSTNRVLLERAKAGAPHGSVLVADHQTAGRGRLGRTWEAEPGAALLVSVLLRPTVPPDRAHLLTFAAGLAAVEACEVVAGAPTTLKWPNDVVAEHDGRDLKLAGLLAESVIDAGSLSAVVLGMGMNLRDLALPEGGVSLEGLCGRDVDRGAVLDAWLAGLDRRLADLHAVPDEYRRASSTLGRNVRVERADEVVQGRAEDVDDRGHLLVRVGDVLVDHAVGDVVHLRAVGGVD
jgi:BirA family biotin operon repressor/biotin-[acetyl-CoA-carboxylase] ligase